MSEQEIHPPKCPSCSVVGTKYIISSASIEVTGRDVPWFYTSHCSSCGYVYGVFTKDITTTKAYVPPTPFG